MVTRSLLNVDGSLFGGYLAALADQALTFAAMTSVPDSMVFRTASIFRETSFLRVVVNWLQSRLTACRDKQWPPIGTHERRA